MGQIYQKKSEKTAELIKTYSDFANNYINKKTLPTIEPLECHVSNTWLNSASCNASDQKWQNPKSVELSINEQKQTVFVSSPSPYDIAFIDGVSVTFKWYTFLDDYIDHPEDEHLDICVSVLDEKLTSVFGFKVGKKRKNGRNFYERSYEVVNHEGVAIGDLNIGGQNSSVQISLLGQACLMADYGWQERYYRFLLTCVDSKITRLDLAHDDLDGTYLDIDDLNERESYKGFYTFGRPPEVSWFGDWKYHDRLGKGRTLQIGSRESDKMLRAYEKGKQLGDKNSLWVRLEVQLGAKHTKIPLNALIKPSDYFIGLYPCFKELFQYDDQEQCRIEYVKRAAEISIDKGINILRQQFGSWLGFFRQWFDNDEQCLDVLAHDFVVPKRFSITQQDWSRCFPDGIDRATV